MRGSFNGNSRSPVAIVGAGPVGLSLALGLARHGVRSTLVERDAATSEYSKAPGIHIRTREIFRLWGVEERLLAAGTLLPTIVMHRADRRRPLSTLEFSRLQAEADRPGLLILEQAHAERLLLEALRETEMCDVRFEAEAVGLDSGESGARLMLHERGAERSLDAEFVVGCDGAGSFVRGAMGLPFEGMTYSLRPVLADVRVDDQRDALPAPRFRNGADGLSFAIRLSPGLWRVIGLDRRPPASGDHVPDEEVGRRTALLLGDGPIEVVWSSRFRIHLRSSPRFRAGRVLLAGDAAHVHSPVGGLGMNAGVQDAANLAWKLAAALSGGDVERLLDSYEVERRAVVVGSVSRFTDVLTRAFIQAPALVREAAFLVFRLMLAVPRAHRRSVRRLSMIDLDYPASPILDRLDHAAGVRLPNPALRSPEGANVRLYDLLPAAAPAMLDVAERDARAADVPVRDVIRIGPGGYGDPSGLLRRLLRGRDGWVLVRPDAHVAWARQHLDGIDEAVRRALGAA